MIGIDWGTTSLRAYRLDPGGGILDRRDSAEGILSVPPGGFGAVLDRVVRPWVAAGERLALLCGMIGSRQGWREAPYLPCPAGPGDIAGALVPLEVPGDLPGLRCLLVPGLTARDAAGVPDVMRGEETKLIGLLAALGQAPAVACLPGTHSKWARVAGGRIQGFATQMTGETRAVLLAHSILGRLAEAPAAEGEGDAAFLRGVRRSADPGGLLHHLFGTRALGLMGDLAPAETDGYLSGLLIGHEVRAAGLAPAGALDGEPGATIHLAGAGTLCRLYGLAFAELGLAWREHDPDIVAAGLAAIGRTIP